MRKVLLNVELRMINEEVAGWVARGELCEKANEDGQVWPLPG